MPRPLVVCLASALATLAAGWLLTGEPTTPHQPAKAIVRETLAADHATRGNAHAIMGRLHSPEHLATVLSAIGAAPSTDLDPEADDQWVEHVRDRLRMTIETAPLSNQRTVAIRYVEGDSQPWSAMLVNKLAGDYVAAFRSTIEVQAQRQFEAAKDAAALGEREIKSARDAMDAWLEQRLAARRIEPVTEDTTYDPPTRDGAASSPGEELRRQLVELEARRDDLLERMTPEHPDVRAVDLDLAKCREKRERFGLHTGQGPVLSSPPARQRVRSEWSIAWDGIADARWHALRRDVADAESRRAGLAEKVSRAEQAMAQAHSVEIAQITPAVALQTAGAYGVRTSWRNLVLVIFVGLVAALAATALFPAATIAAEPSATINTMADFEAEFDIPVVAMFALGTGRGGQSAA